MERDEDKGAKKGWFSKKAKEPTRPQSVSRPPTASTFSKHAGASTVSVDDDLPPRVGTPLGASASTPSVPKSPTKDDVDSKIPIHAGFDFNAIKDVLGKAELNPEELKIPEDNRFEIPAIPPPTNRSESAPPQQQTPPAETADRPPFEPPSPTRTDLAGAFARSMSVNDLDDSDSDTDEPPPPPDKPPAFISPGSLSFGDSSGSVWSPAGTTPPRDVLAFGNPFAPVSHADTGLSFGGADGSITTPPADPWSIPSDLGKKKSSTFNANPWG